MIRQLRTMGDGVKSGLVLVKIKNYNPHETDEPQVWCLFVKTKLETFFEQFSPPT